MDRIKQGACETLVLCKMLAERQGTKGKAMKTRYVIGGLVLAWMVAYTAAVKAGTVATQPNQAGGKIVLTDEPCKHGGKTYTNLNRAYNYGTAGYTSEGCWGVEDETVIVYWIDSDQKMRYPASAFTMSPAYSKKKGSSNEYRY
jgi:hypothetical protein